MLRDVRAGSLMRFWLGFVPEASGPAQGERRGIVGRDRIIHQGIGVVARAVDGPANLPLRAGAEDGLELHAFGGAVIAGQRNVVLTSVELTPYAFLNGPRNYSPIVSAFRASPKPGIIVECRTDYDPLTRD